VFLHAFGVIFHCFSFVHGVEIKLGVVALDGLEVHPQSLLNTVQNQSVGPCKRFCDSEAYHRGSILTGFGSFSPLIVVSWSTGERKYSLQLLLPI